MKALAATVLGLAASSWYNSVSLGNTRCATASSPFSQTEFRQFPLINVYDESHNTKVFRFALPTANESLNLEVASYIMLRFTNKEGKSVVRPYTPINRSDQLGYFEIMVKKYKDSQMGTHLFSLNKGDVVEAQGPWTKIPLKPNQYASIGMIAGGTGITPMYQIARNILREPKNKTNIALIYANRRKEDVLLGNELNELMEAHPRFSPYFILSRASSDWMGGVGHVNKEVIKALMPPPNRAVDSIILVCGPPSFMSSVSGDKEVRKNTVAQGELRGYLKELGYHPRMVFKL